MPKAYIVVNAARRADVPAPAAYLERFRAALTNDGGRVLNQDLSAGTLCNSKLQIFHFRENRFQER
jgi:hypothetical protein